MPFFQDSSHSQPEEKLPLINMFTNRQGLNKTASMVGDPGESALEAVKSGNHDLLTR